MKFLQILVLIIGSVIIANAQVDCIVRNKVFVHDYNGNNVKNSKLEISKVEKGFNKVFAFNPQKIENDTYFFISLLGIFDSPSEKIFTVLDSYWLKVTAENFKTSEQPIKFVECKPQEFTVILEQINQKIKLTGVVYDTNGALVVGAKVNATNRNGEIFEVKTNDDGIYLLNLLPEFYMIEFEQSGFKKTIIESFQLVNSTYGKINQDVVLIVDNSNCGVAGCFPILEPVEIQKTELTDKILQRPLEELPKKPNKSNKEK